MKLAFFALCLCLATNLTGASAKSLDGIRDLVKRRIPKHASSFSFEFMDGPGDSYVVTDARKGRGTSGILVECTVTSACARGLYEYLKERGGVGMWWTGSRLDQLPSRLPPVGHVPIRGSSIVKDRYYFNTVTFSYTTAFWQFEETKDSGAENWSYLLDWLALHGINLPLAWNGHEYILSEVYREAGLSDSDIRSYLSGPAFLSWNRFGNIQGSWGGELPEQWVTDQFALQKKIIQRMVSLGMTPALSSFTGFVPNALHTHYPNASIVTESQWDNFPVSLTNVSFLNPVDPLFTTLQTSYIKKQEVAYGSAPVSHIYALDQYNENTPLEGSLEYLHNVSSNTIASLRAADPQAVWLMQAWMFFSDSAFWNIDRINAYLGGIPNDAAIILDLYSEAQPEWRTTNSYGGKPWVWCALHGFGANIGIEGNLGNLTTQPLNALHSPGSSMQGVGLTMEGHDQGNEIVYGLLLDQAWSSSPINLDVYVPSFASQRYLTDRLPSAALQAWKILASTVYNNSDPNSQATVKSVFVLQPALTGLTNLTGHHPTKIFYQTNQTIVPALKLLLQASKERKELRDVPEFAYDIVNLTRQVLANYFIDIYQRLLAVYNSPDSNASDIASAGKPLLDILGDLDEVLMTNEHFLLSKWIRSARALAGNDHKYADYLEYNARNQITLWGPQGQNNDYAAKDWGGLVRSYYLVRWQTFVGYLEQSKKSGTPYNATEVKAEMLNIGLKWDTEIWGTRPGETWGTRGDTWGVVDKIVGRWM